MYTDHSKYRICGLFGGEAGDFNLAVWRTTIESPNLRHAINILKLNQSLYSYACSSLAKAYYT